MYPDSGSSSMSHDRDSAFAQMDAGNAHRFLDEEAAAAAAVASVNASQYGNYTEHVSPMQESIQGDNESNSKIKRARSMQKITRNRKITSCLQCRERKQKVRKAISQTKDRLTDCFLNSSSATVRNHFAEIALQVVLEVACVLMSTLWKKLKKSLRVKEKRMPSKLERKRAPVRNTDSFSYYCQTNTKEHFGRCPNPSTKDS